MGMYLVRNFGANGTIFDFGKWVLLQTIFYNIYRQRDYFLSVWDKNWPNRKVCMTWVPKSGAAIPCAEFFNHVASSGQISCPFLQLDFIIWTFWFTILSLVVCYNNNFYVKKNCYWSRIYSPWRTKMKQNFCVGGHKIELPPMIKSVSAKFATKNKTTQLLLLLFH